METVAVFVIMLRDHSFKCFENIATGGKALQSGDPVDIRGQDAVILGIGSTKAEAKKNGQSYYYRVSKWHEGEDAVEYQFETQR